MFLAIDIGNTQTVLGLWSHGWKGRWRIVTHPLGTADELHVKLVVLLSTAGFTLRDIEQVAVSSVVPAVNSLYRQVFEHLGPRIHWIDHRSPWSFTIQAEPPASVGADRLVNAEAALREYGSPCIVLDSGTATTLCAINSKREYLGGAIITGLELSLKALTANTAKLFSVEMSAPQRVIGRNTTEALQSGLMWGYASLLEGMIARFKKELSRSDSASTPIPVIATGGVSERFRELGLPIDHFDPDLTLKGIRYVSESLSG